MRRLTSILLLIMSGIVPNAGSLLVSGSLPDSLFRQNSGLLRNIGSDLRAYLCQHGQSSLLAQEGYVSIGLGAGLNHSTIVDDYVSPMQYKGKGYLGKAGMDRVSDRHYNLIEFIYQKNSIEPDLNNGSSARYYRLNFDFIKAWNIRSSDRKLSLFLGGHFLSMYGAQYHEDWYNNSYSYCLSFNIGPSVITSIRPLQANDKLILTWALSVPLFDYVVRPSHGSILPEGTVSKGEENSGTFLTGGSFTSLHEYQRIYSNLYLSWHFSRKIILHSSYQWDFQNYSVNNLYQSANHIILLGLYYRFIK